jgi:phospholipase C
LPGSPLYEKARTGTNIAVSGTLFDILRADVSQNKLPRVSWIVAPEAFSEHGNWPANYGAWYISQVLDALTSNPEVWSKTALFLTYDENDGFFDHMVPPTPPRSAAEGLSTVDTSNDIFPGSASYASGPYGLGVRVPMIVISPWTKGGWVCSELFDHTSLIRFIEKRFAHHDADLIETNITAWHRAICGDLTSAFDFKTPDARLVELPDTTAYMPPDHDRHPDYVPVPPTDQALPKQERGLRHARALPYELQADGTARNASGEFRIDFANTGESGACFQVRSGNTSDGPWTFTVETGKSLSYTWDLAQSLGAYDLSVFGPNGFLRTFRGSASRGAKADLDVDARYEVDGYAVELRVTNRGQVPCKVNVANAYGDDDKSIDRLLRPGEGFDTRWPLRASFGWYDLSVETDADASFLRRVAGHLENGQDSASDPAFGS